ncbi:MAG TPA: hypothetical protein VNO26_16730 [Candidatus Limnocylindria bacterium]|nr:hypothetical protein [Candidatus Limnocylindria bacterium]
MRRVALALIALACAAGAALAAPKRKVVKVKVGPFPIEAERDREICQAIRVPGIGGLEIVSAEARSRVSNRGDTGSHHLVVYGYSGADVGAFPDELTDDPGCNGFGPTDFYVRRVFVAGSGGETRRGNWTVTRIAWPGDLTQVVPAVEGTNDAVIVVNSHYFNNARKRAKGTVKVKLVLRPLTPGKRVLRQVIHLDASRDIFVPPGATGSVSSTFQADGAPNFSTEGGFNPASDVCLFTVSTHMHKRGMLFTIDWEQDGQSTPLLAWPDYIHPGTIFRPGPLRGLLKAYTAENGLPRIRYGCDFANGTNGVEMKKGCEEEPGVVPGMSWAEGEGLGLSPLETHATPCGKDGVNCGGAACVDANLVFGPLSDDDMCVLTAMVYDPLPDVPDEQACDLRTTY